MARTGIDNPWRPEGEPEPEPLGEWVAAGVPAEEAETWRAWRYRLSQAQDWRRAGVFGGLQAAQWSAAGVSAQSVNQWRAATIDAREAATWRELGFTFEEAKHHKANGRTPSQAYDQRSSGPGGRSSGGLATRGMGGTAMPFRAGRAAPGGPRGPRRFLEAGVRPEVFHSYLLRQWNDDEAVGWAKEGIDAADAKLWKELGLRPDEASRLTRRGTTVFQTVRDWWQAGIPIDEVADWLGAGLEPEEAARQRARGVTAEQAATLRALRDDPD